MKNIIVIIPTYNEIRNISQLIESIKNIEYNLDLLFIDDNSPDGTGKLLKKISIEQKNIYVICLKMDVELYTYHEIFENYQKCPYSF